MDDVRKILGIWFIDPKDSENVDEYGRVTLEFQRDNKLIYTIHCEGKTQHMFLTYKLENGFLITDQPSHPNVEKTQYKFTDDGKLVLKYINKKATFIKKIESRETQHCFSVI